MNKNKLSEKLDIMYFTDPAIIKRGFCAGSCLHMICLEGNSSFIYGERLFSFSGNDLIIISKPEQMKNFTVSSDFRMECLVAPLKFLYNQLPANHYGIGGCISLWDDPVIGLNKEDIKLLSDDFSRLRDRINETDRLFYQELIGSLALTMIYDLFEVHARRDGEGKASDSNARLVSELLNLLQGGRTKQYREVAYYASQLNVSPKYLSNLVSRQTGRSVSYLIDQHTMPMIIRHLKNSKMSLTQIADEFNFSSLSYFSRYVQKNLGMAPSEYRASLQPKKHSQGKRRV